MKTKIKTVIGRHVCRCNHSFGWSLRSKLLISILAGTLILISACSGGGGGKLSGTYVNADTGMSYVFSGNKVKAEMDGSVIAESTFEVKDGKLIIIGEKGDVTESELVLQGNTLTLDLGGMKMVFTKK